MTGDRAHRLGILLVTLSAITWSTAGLFTRVIDVDTWTLVFWRSVFGAGFLAAVLVLRERGGVMLAIRSMGGAGWSVVGLQTVAMVSYLCALRLTAVADVMIVYATVPFVAAALAWLVLGERASHSTLVASGIAGVGVVVMLGAPRWPGAHGVTPWHSS